MNAIIKGLIVLLGVAGIIGLLLVINTLRLMLDAPATAVPVPTPLIVTPTPELVRTAFIPTATPTLTRTPEATRPPQTHIVQRGETLFRIAQQYGVTVEAIIAANELTNPDRVIVGQELIIPVEQEPTPTATESVALPYPPAVVANLREIYARGQQMGNNPRMFAKVGDSITRSGSFLRPIGEGDYNLGEHDDLEAVVTHYINGTAQNPFSLESVAAQTGWAATAVLDPTNADTIFCATGETPLACEYRLSRPAVALIMLGTNDVGYRAPSQYRQDLEQIVAISVDRGVIPVLSTIPPQPNVGARVDAFNAVVRDVALTNDLPLWDYHAALRSLPNTGLHEDGVHPSTPPGGINSVADFRPPNLDYGYVVRNLTALQMLQDVLVSVEAL